MTIGLCEINEIKSKRQIGRYLDRKKKAAVRSGGATEESILIPGAFIRIGFRRWTKTVRCEFQLMTNR